MKRKLEDTVDDTVDDVSPKPKLQKRVPLTSKRKGKTGSSKIPTESNNEIEPEVRYGDLYKGKCTSLTASGKHHKYCNYTVTFKVTSVDDEVKSKVIGAFQKIATTEWDDDNRKQNSGRTSTEVILNVTV